MIIVRMKYGLIPKCKSLQDRYSLLYRENSQSQNVKHEAPLKIENITYTAAKQGQHLLTVTYILKLSHMTLKE